MNKKNRAMPNTVEQKPNGEIIIDLDRRLMEEINILRLEGSLFCFDPREARRRTGRLTLADARKAPITVDVNPSYGQPSVLAYRVLQAVFLKITEEGLTFTEDGRAVYRDTASFSQRELASLVGRAWSGKKLSEELFTAIMQLRRTGITASLYDKETGEWQVYDFSVLADALFAGRGDTLTRCAVRLAPSITASINKRHVAFFNLYRLSILEPIGLVLYKRVFYHLSNLFQPGSAPRDLRFTKDYESICREWLGGLKPRRYKSDIIKDQLGHHLDAIKASGLLRRWSVEKNAEGTGFNVSFWPGKGFFTDYELYYLAHQQPRLQFKASAELRTIQMPLELVSLFHQQLGHDRNRFEEHETAYADELLEEHHDHDIRDLIAYAIEEAKKTRFEMLFFSALKRYHAPWKSDRARRQEREAVREQVAACPYCDEAGYLHLAKRISKAHVVHACPHVATQISRLEEELAADRL